MKNPSENDMDNYSHPSTSSQLQLPVLQYTELTNISGLNLSPPNPEAIEHNRLLKDHSTSHGLNTFNSLQKHEFFNTNNNESDLVSNQSNNSTGYNIIPSIIKEENDENPNLNITQKQSTSSLGLQEINQKRTQILFI